MNRVAVVALFGAILIFGLFVTWLAMNTATGAPVTTTTTTTAAPQTIYASNTTIKVPKCPAGESLNALFTISGIDTQADAPPSILVGLNGDSTVTFDLFRFDSNNPPPGQTGPIARYKGSAPKGVNFGQATIYAAWVGIFELEEYFCGQNIPPTTTTTSTSSTTSTTSTAVVTTTTTLPGGAVTPGAPPGNAATTPTVPEQPTTTGQAPVFVTG